MRKLQISSDTINYYLTTSIPYVNAKPHIGQALENIQTDVFARAAADRIQGLGLPETTPGD